MFLLAGLGNPGTEYARTRHNAGFMVMDELAHHLGCVFTSKKKFHSDYTEAELGGHKVVLVKPTTYMNLSGRAIHAVSHFYKIPPERMIVFHDDLALAFGKIRVKQGGGAAGHNGLKDIDAHLGPQYIRVRIGVHHPGDKGSVSDYVLGSFTPDELAVMAHAIPYIAECTGLLLEGKYDLFMTKIVENMRKNTAKENK